MGAPGFQLGGVDASGTSQIGRQSTDGIFYSAVQFISTHGSTGEDKIAFYTHEPGDRGVRMTIDGGGKIGFGTETPDEKFEFFGGVLRCGDSTGRVKAYADGIIELGGGPGKDGTTNGGVNRIIGDSAGFMQFFTNGATNERMRIKADGTVGIGTTSPSYPLEVGTGVGANFSGIGEYRTFKYNDTNLQSSVGNSSVSIKAQAMIWAGGYGFITNSDSRIKENVRDVSDNHALAKLRDISCVNYEYKDKLKRGNSTTIGFIAQQVREHMPMAVSIQKDIIPNEMRNIESPIWTTITDSSANSTYKLTISDLSDNSGNTLYRFYVSNDPSGNDECKKEIYSLTDDPKVLCLTNVGTMFLFMVKR